MLLEIFFEHVGRRRRDIAGLRRTQSDVFDAALLVLVAIDGGDGDGRHVHFADQALRQLPAQHDAPLLLDIAAFGETGLADQLLEPRAVELAGEPAEVRIGGDAAGDLGVADAEAERLGLLVERGFRRQLADQLAVDAERARLVGRDRAAGAAADLAQLVVVIFAELLDRDLGAADGDRGVVRGAAEYVADAPDREADDQEPITTAMRPLPSQVEEALWIPRSMRVLVSKVAVTG